MSTSTLMHRIGKLEVYADLIKEETIILRQHLSEEKASPKKKAVQKIAAGIIAKRMSNLQKGKRSQGQ